jgi:hypothetical protein
MLGHSTDHRIAHFETNGVVVTSHPTPKPTTTITAPPLTNRIQ